MGTNEDMKLLVKQFRNLDATIEANTIAIRANYKY